jgi:hypothetical protein
MRRWFERWLPDDSYLTRQLWLPLQCLIAGFHHPHRTTANTELALLTTVAQSNLTEGLAKAEAPPSTTCICNSVAPWEPDIWHVDRKTSS